MAVPERHLLQQTRSSTDLDDCGPFKLLVHTWKQFHADEGGERAAALGYYALFSLFPLIVLSALLLTWIVGEEQAHNQVILIGARYLPTDLGAVSQVVQNVLDNRGTLSAVSLLAVTWGGLQVFRVLERAINRAWAAPERRSFWRHLLFALVMVTITGVLTIASIWLSTLFQLARPLNFPYFDWAPLDHPVIWAIVSVIPPLALDTALLLLLYRYVPHLIDVTWHDVWPAAIFSAVLWEGARRIFTFYLSNFARQNYNLLYGSLGVTIALLTWVYLMGYIILMGAELSSVLAQRRHEREAVEEGE